MAGAVLAVDHHGRGRALYPLGHPRNSGFCADHRTTPGRAHPGPRSHQASAQTDRADGILPDGRAGTVLCLCRLCLCLWDKGFGHVPRFPADRGAGRDAVVGGDHPACRPHLRPYRAQAHVPNRCGDDRHFYVHLFRDDEQPDAGADLSGDRFVVIPHDMMYGPQAALIAECFTPRLRYSGSSLGFHLASIIAGGPAPLIATALFAAFRSGYAVACYVLFCAVVSITATLFLPDYTNRDISHEFDAPPVEPEAAAAS